MTTLNTAQKAAILLDGVPVTGASQIIPSSQNFTVSTVDDVSYVVAVAPDPACTLIVRKGGREGVVAFDIVDAPLDITLGSPEPK